MGTSAGSSADVRYQQSFPGVQALHNVDLFVRAVQCLRGWRKRSGQEHADEDRLRGLCADEGTIVIEGQGVVPATPYHAQQLGVSIIYQEFNLFNMTIEENIFIGREPNRVAFRRLKPAS